MIAPTGSTPHDQGQTISQSMTPLEHSVDTSDKAPRDLYAESELQLRHERTERMIQKALDQS